MALIIFGELYSSKNHRMIVRAKQRMFVVKAKNAKRQETDFAFQLASSANRLEWDAMIKGKSFPVKISFKRYRRTLGRFDYTNIVQGLLDAMVKAEYLPDDSMNYVIPVFEPFDVDKSNPRTVITIIS